MPLTENDLVRIREVVQLAIQDEKHGVPPMMVKHEATCPHGQKIAKTKWMLVGICIGAFIAGGGSAFAIARVLLM